LAKRLVSRRFLPPDPHVEEPYRLTPRLALRVGLLGMVALAAESRRYLWSRPRRWVLRHGAPYPWRARLALGLYGALVLRSTVFGDPIFWNLLWEAGPA